MSDTVVSFPASIAVPGLKIAYQFQIGEGRMLAYEAAADSTVHTDDLNKLLDTMRDAGERQKAFHDLPFHQARLAQNRELLPKRKRELQEVVSQAHARVAARSSTRRGDVPVRPEDNNAIMQHETRVAELEATIRSDELRVPYLQAIIAGREPPDLFPELGEDARMAAE